MKRILTLILVILINSVYGQCKTETDEFTGVRITKSKEKTLVSSTIGYGVAIEVQAVRKNDILYIDVHISDKSHISVAKGGAFMIKTTSGVVVNLEFYEYASTDSRNYADSQARRDLYNFLMLNEKDFEILKNNDIEKIRFSSMDGYIEKDIKGRNQGELRELLNCV